MSSSPYPMFGIPRWDQPFDEEHPPGLMLRLAQLNRFRTVSTVERETGVAMADVKIGRGLDDLARIVCSDPERVAADAFVYGLGAKVTIRGEEVSPKRDLRRRARRVCPSCLSESPHARFWWDLAFVSSCPRHRCLLEDRCSCPKRGQLTWHDGRVGGCRACDEGDLATATPKPAPAAILAVDEYSLGRLGVVPARQLALLDELPLFEAVDVLERVGALSLGGYSKTWPNAHRLSTTWNDLLAEGWAVLSSRDGLAGALDRGMAGSRAAGAAPSLTTSYGWFYHWLNGKGGRGFSGELAEAVVSHAESRFVVDKRARAALLPPTETCTLVEAAARCGVSQTVMRDVLEQRSLISREKIRGQAFRLPATEMEGVVTAMRNSVDARGATHILGTTTKTLRELRALDLIRPWVSGSRQTKHAYIFLRADIDGFLNTLSAGLPERWAVEEDETTLTEAARAYAVPLAVLCREVLEGRLILFGRMATGGGLQGLIVRRQDALESRRRLRRTGIRAAPACRDARAGASASP